MIHLLHEFVLFCLTCAGGSNPIAPGLGVVGGAVAAGAGAAGASGGWGADGGDSLGSVSGAAGSTSGAGDAGGTVEGTPADGGATGDPSDAGPAGGFVFNTDPGDPSPTGPIGADQDAAPDDAAPAGGTADAGTAGHTGNPYAGQPADSGPRDTDAGPAGALNPNADPGDTSPTGPIGADHDAAPNDAGPAGGTADAGTAGHTGNPYAGEPVDPTAPSTADGQVGTGSSASGYAAPPDSSITIGPNAGDDGDVIGTRSTDPGYTAPPPESIKYGPIAASDPGGLTPVQDAFDHSPNPHYDHPNTSSISDAPSPGSDAPQITVNDNGSAIIHTPGGGFVIGSTGTVTIYTNATAPGEDGGASITRIEPNGGFTTTTGSGPNEVTTTGTTVNPATGQGSNAVPSTDPNTPRITVNDNGTVITRTPGGGIGIGTNGTVTIYTNATAPGADGGASITRIEPNGGFTTTTGSGPSETTTTGTTLNPATGKGSLPGADPGVFGSHPIEDGAEPAGTATEQPAPVPPPSS